MRVRLSGCNSISVFTVFSLISVPSFHAGHCRLSTVSLTIFFLSILLFLKHFQPPQRQPPSSKAILVNNKTMSNFELIVNSYYYIFFLYKVLRTFSFFKWIFTLNPLSAYPTKWLNTLEQFVGKLPTNCLSVFDHFWDWRLKG